MTLIPCPMPPPYLWTTAMDSDGGLRAAVLWHGPRAVLSVECVAGLWEMAYPDGSPIRDAIVAERLESIVRAFVGLPDAEGEP